MQHPPRSATSSTRPTASPLPRAQTAQSNTRILDTVAGKILCIADVRGRLSSLNDLAKEVGAKAVIHTGDFGFFESSSLERIGDRTLRHLATYSPLVPSTQRTALQESTPAALRSTMSISLLSEFPLLLSGQIKLNIPVYTVWGACEDVVVLENFRLGTYNIDNLHILDEATTHCVDVGGVKLRMFGLGGAFVPHKMFDNGEGNATIAGGQGTMWTTALQLGELVDTAQRVYDVSETRLLVTHASPGREGIIAQMALALKVDLTISAGLHFRYSTSYNEFSVQGDFEGFRHKLIMGKEGFDKVWNSVKTQVDAVIDDNQRVFLDKALAVIERIPPAQSNLGPGGTATGDEPAWKNTWNWNLCDAAYGSLILDIKEGRVSAELKSHGFNYAYRRSSTTAAPAPASAQATSPVPKPSIPLPKSAAASSAPTPPAIQSTVVSGKATPIPEPLNGKDTASNAPSDKTDKDKSKKDKKRDKRDKFDSKDRSSELGTEPKESTASQNGSALGKLGTPAADPVNKFSADSEAPGSPATESTGARTPTSKRPPRNPWTLFIRMPNPANETELREFFGEAKSGITRIKLPQGFGRSQKIAYVEFGDEEAMKAGLSGHAEKLKDAVPHVVQAEDRESRDHGNAFRGRGRGGYAARGFAAAGLTRQVPRNNAVDVSSSKDTAESKDS